jgi:hypothetical protein
MRANRRVRGRSRATDPFIDLLFNALLGFTFLFLLAIMFINPTTDRGRVNLKAEFIISVTWPEQLADDIDLWVQDPIGDTVSYLRKEAGWLHLDRDDRGIVNDTIVIDGEEVVYPINQEIVTIRGILPGEYIVNLYYYKAAQARPVEALVKVERVNPALQTVFVERVQLERQDDEKTVVRFTLNRRGDVESINRLPKALTPYGF